MFNVAVLPFGVLSDNHKIHIFMSKNNKKKNVCWSVNDTKPKASIYSHYHHPHHLINTAACLAQLGEHLSAEWKVAGSNPGFKLRVFKWLMRKSCLCNDICKQLDFQVSLDNNKKA